jgi:hypothetical protein
MAWHPMLQYENALNTRSLWYRLQGDGASPEARQWLQGYTGRWKGLPVVELLTASGYQFLGREDPWLAGIVTCLIWLLACALFHQIAARELQSPVAALAATSLLAFHSLGLVLSRSYQHEAISLLGLMIAWWALWRWDVQSSWRNVLLVALVAGLALLTKPGIMWLPWCGILMQQIVHQHGWRGLVSFRWIVTMVLAVVPSVLWQQWLLPGEGHQWKFAMLLTADWYSGVAWQLVTVVGVLPLGMMFMMVVMEAILGCGRFLIMLLACIAYLLLFCYAALTHEYYLMPLLPLVCLTFGWRWEGIGLLVSPRWRILPLGLVLTALVGWGTAQFVRWTPAFGADYQAILTSGPYRPYAAKYKALGKQLGPGTPVLALTLDYSMPLRYFGHVHAQWWPTQLDLWYERLDGRVPLTARQRLAYWYERCPFHYFVVTLPEELDKQPELLKLLQEWEEVPCVVPGWRVWSANLPSHK